MRDSLIRWKPYVLHASLASGPIPSESVPPSRYRPIPRSLWTSRRRPPSSNSPGNFVLYYGFLSIPVRFQERTGVGRRGAISIHFGMNGVACWDTLPTSRRAARWHFRYASLAAVFTLPVAIPRTQQHWMTHSFPPLESKLCPRNLQPGKPPTLLRFPFPCGWRGVRGADFRDS